MIIESVTIDDPRLRELITELDAGLEVTDGEEHAFYDQFNGLGELKMIFMGNIEGIHMACGGFKILSNTKAELKRMYVRPDFRGNKHGETILNFIEEEIKKAGITEIVLETGVEQKSAIRLYERNNYRRIQNYGPYKGKALSICMGKDLS